MVGNSGGDHDPEFLEYHVRVKEIEVAKVRAVNQISYVEEIKRVEEMVVGAPQPVGNVSCQSNCMLKTWILWNSLPQL